MKTGTKSILFGAHQFIIHPIFLALGWFHLYGFRKVQDPYLGWVSLWNPRLWLVFLVHDLGYWGKARMDDEDGEQHPLLGARILSATERPRYRDAYGFYTGGMKAVRVVIENRLGAWGCFTYFHSRFLSKREQMPFSLLCAADKMAVALEPWWLYLPRVWASGEVWEYYHLARAEGSKYDGEERFIPDGVDPDSLKGWCLGMQNYCKRWALTHKDGRADKWTKAL